MKLLKRLVSAHDPYQSVVAL